MFAECMNLLSENHFKWPHTAYQAVKLSFQEQPVRVIFLKDTVKGPTEGLGLATALGII